MSTQEIAETLIEIKELLKAPAKTRKLTAEEAATYCKVDVQTIHAHSKAGLITYSQPTGRKMYFYTEDLDEYLDRNKKEAVTPQTKTHKKK